MGIIHAKALANKAISGMKASTLVCLAKKIVNPVDE